MDDLYEINVAKTKICDAFSSGDVSLLDAVLDPSLVNFSDTEQSWWGTDGIDSLKQRIKKWHTSHRVNLEVIIIEIRLMGDTAVEYGWQTVYLDPKNGAAPVSRRERYVDVWKKNKNNWRLVNRCTNLDVLETLTSEF